jgi:hypothetical protein
MLEFRHNQCLASGSFNLLNNGKTFSGGKANVFCFLISTFPKLRMDTEYFIIRDTRA